MYKNPIPIFVGWDSREDIAYQVCRHSLVSRTSIPLDIIALRQEELRRLGCYTRALDPLASTEFTYTRFLVPYLMDYEGWAIFCDSDFLWLSDIKELMDLADDKYALMCVHHDYRPPEAVKMDGRAQTVYPRKNWSSLVLYNCGHPKNRFLSPNIVNTESGAFLHRFQWLDDEDIAPIPESYNWLDGWSKIPENNRLPKAVHYTRGGPWFESWQDVSFAAEWVDEEKKFHGAGGVNPWNVLDFWFQEANQENWFVNNPTFDAQIRERFGALHSQAIAGDLKAWRKTAHGALAEIILLDQFSRNIYRNDSRAFAYDDMARDAHHKAMALRYDRYLSLNQRHFLYLPLQHSEAKEDQVLSISLYRTLGDAEIYQFAIRHKEIIDRFGRFPHRNQILGRKSTKEEKSFLTESLSAF